ncbi:hypothetical protein ACI2OX_11865 [Bacillus sp. N9]
MELAAAESEIYKLKDFVAVNPLNLPLESHAKHGRAFNVMK